MPSTPPAGGVVFVEPLESRIAPTGLYAISGEPSSSTATSDPHYVTFHTLPTATSLGFVPASTYGINVANLYAIKLTGNGTVNSSGFSNGDELVPFNAVTGFNLTVPLIQANSGTVVAFFIDDPGLHGDASRLAGQVYADELVGVSMGKKAAITINGNVYGDVATNLLDGGTLVSTTSVGKSGQAIYGINMNGNVYGDILSGGIIKNVNLIGSVDNVLAGTATNGVPFDFSGDTAAPTGTITNVAKPGIPGANINKFTVSTLATNGRIQAGDGGLTAIGGAVTNLVVTGDPGAFDILSGAGGGGTAAVSGGTGGAISAITIQGAGNSTVNAPILIQAGHGGDDALGVGGKGGGIDGLAIGFNLYDPSTNTGTMSADLLAQNIIVHGGDGGSGVKGGNGGSVTDSDIVGAIPDDGVVAADGSANPEVQVFGGAGGVATAVGRGIGGHGGNIGQVTVENLDVNANALSSSILVQGGAGGAGKGGGSVSNLDLLGTILTVNGGMGGNGIAKGGAGGLLSAISVTNLSNLYAHDVTLNGGVGGDSTTGYGGAGGSIDSVTLPDGDLTSVAINTGTHANGGQGANGLGGAGGAVTNLSLNNDAVSGVIATISIRTGQGGAGSAGGGPGGLADTLQILGTDFSFSVASGAGGSVLGGGTGSGGAGGILSNVGIVNIPPDSSRAADPTPLSGAVSSGAGGDGAGVGGAGGAGGNLIGVDVSAVYNVSMTAGNAGNGPAGAGTGGGINTAAAISLQGGVTVASGAGGQTSGLASDGGSITGLIAAAQTNIVIGAGNGGSGGAGGSISNSGTTTNTPDPSLVAIQPLALPNVGNLTVTAGNGSSQNGVAGAGGSITGFTGYVADAGSTALTAGSGGGGATSTASGAGGSIDTVSLIGTSGANAALEGATSQIVTLDGGNAGVAGDAAKGRPGGGVSNVTIYELDPNTVVQHIAAGDGASGSRKGGAGGSISGIHVGQPGDVAADIGIRSGVVYGYAVGDAGGIFAGIGGIGAKVSGANGDVTDVTASAISSIVAGKGAVQLCTMVDGIYLDGVTATVADSTGAFTNFDTANLVGSVENPTAAGASVFAQGDGLIAAADLTQNRNFVPEALFTVDAAGNLVLVDYQQPNPVPVVTPAPAYLV